MSSVASAFRRAAETTQNVALSPARWVRDDRYSWFLCLMVWVLVILMIVPDGFMYDPTAANVMPESGSTVSRMLWLSLLGSAFVVIAWRASFAWLLVTRWLNPFLLLFVALVIVSVLWSISPTVTIRRWIRVITMVGDAVAFTLMGWHARRFQNVVRPILTIVLAGSIVFGLIDPTLAIHQSLSPELHGAWHGLTMQKNTLGALACMGCIFWFHGWLVGDIGRLRALAGFLIAGACLVLSKSSTSLITCVFTCTFLVLLLRSPPNLRRFMPYIVTLFVAILLLYSLAILKLVPGLEIILSPITAITGKDLTFSNRSVIWAIIGEHIAHHPVLGTGYGAYWTGPEPTSPSYVFVTRMFFYPGSAHSGYLEIVNDLGVIGLFCLLGYLVTHVRQSLQLLREERGQGALYLAIFFQQAITNFSETHWLSVLSVNFVIMTLTTAAVARSLLERRLYAFYGQPLHLVQAGGGPGVPAMIGEIKT